MKSNINRIFTLVLVLVLMTQPIFSNAKTNIEKPKDVKKIERQLDLKKISKDELPKGTEPVMFETWDEYYAFLSELNKTKSFKFEQVNDEALVMTRATSGTSSRIGKKSLGFITLNVRITYTWGYSGSNKIFTSQPSTYHYLTGITTGSSWNVISETIRRTDGDRHCDVYGTGLLTTPFGDPTGTLWSYTKDYNYSFSIKP